MYFLDRYMSVLAVFLILLPVSDVCGIHCVCDRYWTCGTSCTCGSSSADGRIGDGGGVSCPLHGCLLTIWFSPLFPWLSLSMNINHIARSAQTIPRSYAVYRVIVMKIINLKNSNMPTIRDIRVEYSIRNFFNCSHKFLFSNSFFIFSRALGLYFRPIVCSSLS